MQLFFSSLILLAPFLERTNAQTLSHPALPNPIRGDFDIDLESYLWSSTPDSYTVTPWANTTSLPQICWRTILDLGLSPNDIDVAEIRYPDCDKEWTVCKVQSASITWDQFAKTLGGIPIGMRQWTSNIMITPDSLGKCGLAYQEGLVLFSAGCVTNRVLIHEFGHQMDLFALRAVSEGRTRYSSSSRWLNAYDSDSHVVTEYARTNQVENFAETGAFAIMDGLVATGVGRYIDKALVDDQLKDWSATARAQVWVPNCASKLVSSRAVYKSNGHIVPYAGVAAAMGADTEEAAIPEKLTPICEGYHI